MTHTVALVALALIGAAAVAVLVGSVFGEAVAAIVGLFIAVAGVGLANRHASNAQHRETAQDDE